MARRALALACALAAACGDYISIATFSDADCASAPTSVSVITSACEPVSPSSSVNMRCTSEGYETNYYPTPDCSGPITGSDQHSLDRGCSTTSPGTPFVVKWVVSSCNASAAPPLAAPTAGTAVLAWHGRHTCPVGNASVISYRTITLGACIAATDWYEYAWVATCDAAGATVLNLYPGGCQGAPVLQQQTRYPAGCSLYLNSTGQFVINATCLAAAPAPNSASGTSVVPATIGGAVAGTIVIAILLGLVIWKCVLPWWRLRKATAAAEVGAPQRGGSTQRVQEWEPPMAQWSPASLQPQQQAYFPPPSSPWATAGQLPQQQSFGGRLLHDSVAAGGAYHTGV